LRGAGPALATNGLCAALNTREGPNGIGTNAACHQGTHQILNLGFAAGIPQGGDRRAAIGNQGAGEGAGEQAGTFGSLFGQNFQRFNLIFQGTDSGCGAPWGL
jgi:hypothetical protein